MPNIVIDPLIMRMPPNDATKVVVKMWLENLDTWLEEALTVPFTWLHYQQATMQLYGNGEAPDFLQLKQLSNKHDLDINIKQIAEKINVFFRDDTLDITEHLKQLEIVTECEAGSITIKPEQFMARLPNYLHNDLHTLLADCCACKHIKHNFGQELHIATLAMQDSSKELAVSVVILDALPAFIRSADNRITQHFPLLITPNDLLHVVDTLDLWSKGEHGIIYAIKQQFAKTRSIMDVHPFKFHLGPHFLESVNNRGLDNNEVVLRSIIRAASDIIADQVRGNSGYHLHALRTSEAADSPQLVRDSDQARAWRLMISKRGAGWRLHYWQIPTPMGSSIEFANICKESERIIY